MRHEVTDMNEMTPTIDDIQQIVRDLEEVLERLDAFQMSIAAVHVQTGLDAVRAICDGAFERRSAHPGSQH